MRRSTCLVVLAGLAGCAIASAPAGHDYAQAGFDRFVLGQTTVAEAEALLGPPIRQSALKGIASATASIVPPGSHVSLVALNYYYAPMGFGQRGPHPAKAASVMFVADHLVGYEFSNSIPGEVTPPIDDNRLSALHQGQTTRAQAIALLGTPLHQLMRIVGPQTGASEIAYGWGHRHDGVVDQRVLRINFDPAGHMTTYSVLENSFPAGSAPMLQFNPQAPQPGTPQPGLQREPMPRADREHT